MGQNNSALGEILPDSFTSINWELRGKAQILQEINNLTREDFDKYLEELNELSRNCLFDRGRQMVFSVRKETDTNSFLWKVTIRINCIKFNPATKRIDSITVISLRQFVQLFRTFQAHLETMILTENNQRIDDNLLEQACACSTNSSLNEESLNEECCICLDRKPDLILPCSHLFCETCIEQWNTNNKTCPICQEKLTSTDDSWVIPNIPDAGEISKEIQETFMHISDKGDDLSH